MSDSPLSPHFLHSSAAAQTHVKFFIPLVLSTVLALPFPSQTQGSTLYQDPFATNPYTGTARWEGVRWDGTTLVGATHNSAPHDAGWNPGNQFGVGGGYIYVQHTGASVPSDYLLNTTGTLSINPDVAYQSLYVSWYSNQSAAPDAARRFAIEVDGAWYVATSSPFLNGSQYFLDFLTATWNPVSSTDLSVDTSITRTFADLFDEPTDTIAGLGFLIEDMPAAAGSTRTVRFDSLAMTSGLLWGGASGTGGNGTWSSTNAWVTSPTPTPVTANWSDHQTAIFGHAYDTTGPGTVTVTGNVIARSLEFYDNADGYILRGDVAPGGDGVPVRTIQISNATPFRSIYVAPEVNVTVGGDAATGLRIYRTGATSPMHIYGGGTLTIDLNGMVRSEGGGNVIVNHDATVIVKAGGQFTSSRDMFIGSFTDTQDGPGGSGTVIFDGGTGTTRTGASGGGDLFLGGSTGTATFTVKNNGSFTTHAGAPFGVQFQGTGVINLESGGTLYTRKIGKATGAPGTATLRFDGGKVVINATPAAGTGTFIGSDVDFVYVSGGGAIFDTNGFNATLGAPLRHDPTGPATDGGLTKLGLGNLTLSGGAANTYNGVITIKQGKLITPTFDELGDAPNSPSNIVLDGGTWEHTGGASTNRGITVTANGGTLSGNTAWRINGNVVGAADSTLFIAGNAWLSGNNASTFHGLIDVLSGEFLVRRASSLGSAQGGVIVRSGATFSLDHNGTGGGNFLTSDNTYNDDLVLKEGSRLRNRGQTNLDNAGAIYAGDITLEGPGQAEIEVRDNGATLPTPDLTITGGIAGAGGLNKTGTGRLIITSQAAYTGKTTVSAGTLALQGTASLTSPWIEIQTGAQFDVSALSSTPALTSKILSGTGSVQGNMTLGQNSLLKPGASTLATDSATAGALAGTLTFTNNLSLTDNATAYFQISGSSTYDQLDVLGQFSAGNSTQIIVQWLGYEGVQGDAFDLMDWASVTWGSTYTNEATLLSQLLLPSFTDTSLRWDTGTFLSDGILRVAAVPEPASGLLFAGGLAMLLLHRRRLR
ncbi:autotransporter-associated beta strand repeat-containing protein [Roseimicrobium gellanilyticum]|uniref:autotransporter-associated beta strand repeat-containing protein n=1 Tax=Roseimicrobium gellanilyticum TaxID=748857 RepID=UPI0011BE196E|nr:autotransporter-associated beta strand repeat-containing protein [Roseimicrobium gellanilyticum]